MSIWRSHGGTRRDKWSTGGWVDAAPMGVAIVTFAVDTLTFALAIVAWRSARMIFAGVADPKKLRGPMHWNPLGGCLGFAGFVAVNLSLLTYAVAAVREGTVTWASVGVGLLCLLSVACGIAAGRLSFGTLDLKVPFPPSPEPPTPAHGWPNHPS